MKKITYIIISVVITTMIMGIPFPTYAQSKPLFSETYPSEQIFSALDEDDPAFRILDRSGSSPESALLGTCEEKQAAFLMEHLQKASIHQHFPDNTVFAWGHPNPDGKRRLYALKKGLQENIPTTADVQSVSIQEGRNPGTFELLLDFNNKGKEQWANLTRNNVGRDIAIVVEDKVVSAPKVQQEIKFGKCMISGNFSKDEALKMKASLLKK